MELGRGSCPVSEPAADSSNILVAAEAVISHEQKKRDDNHSHQSVMGDQHDQHPDGYK